MKNIRGRKRALALPSLAAAAAITLALAGCSGSSRPAPARLEITHTGTDRVVEPGQRTSYEITARNSGGSEATDISFKGYDGQLSSVVDVQCKQVSGGATCPVPMSVAPTVFKLPAGAAITFEFTFEIDADATGIVNDTVFVRSGYGDEDVMQKVTVHDAYSGAYRLYAADGEVLAANVDFMASRLSLEGGTVDRSLPFFREDPLFQYDLYKEGTEPRELLSPFLTPTDLMAGTLDLGFGVQPFVAARDFVTTLAELDGQSFVITSRDAATGGAATTQAWAARFEGATLVACRTAAPLSVENCPAPAQTRYALAAGADGAFTRTDPSTGETVAFRVARSGDARIYLAADAPAGHQRFEVGLQPKTELDRHVFYGGDTTGRWGTLNLATNSYAGVWGITTPFVSALAPVPGGPTGLFAARSLADGAMQFVVAQGPLVLAVGMPGGSLDGEMQLWARAEVSGDDR